jgi:uncharacterized membrane protein
MPWLKLLHISAVIVWCGALLYLPAAIAAGGRRSPRSPRHGVLRALFTTVATPAALLAVASGTAVFVWQGPLAGWLIAKLACVGLLVVAHLACGLLILRIEGGRARHGADRGKCVAVEMVAVLSLAGTAGLVLWKPF